MIIEATACVAVMGAAVPSQGRSEAAHFVAAKQDEGRRRLLNSYFLNASAKEALAQIELIAEECKLAKWDGYEAAPISATTVMKARWFVQTIPLGIPVGTVGAESDGQLTFEWYRSPRHTLSISISADGYLHYAALIGPNRQYGTEIFFGDIPASILELIYRVNGTYHLGAA